MDMLVRKHPMPEIADFVSKLRDAFGDATIDEAVARGKAGEPTFFAQEAGRTVGMKPVDDFNRWAVDGSVRDRHYCKSCDGSCVGTGVRCSSTDDGAGAIWLNLAASSATVFR
nr:hypothetical protein [Caballeronia novacaledonica]